MRYLGPMFHTFNVGDRVLVEPSSIEQLGRGIGVIKRIATDRATLALVKFENIKGGRPGGAVACFVAECRPVGASNAWPGLAHHLAAKRPRPGLPGPVAARQG